MNLIKPKKLKKGDTITIIATSGNVNIEKIKEGVKYFHEKGFNVKLGKHIEKTDKYMAGSDIERLEDLHNAFADEEVNAIICARGGYGAIRLIDKIDYSIIQNNPKIFCGYSDITALSAMILKKTGLITFSGPMVQSDFSTKDKLDKFTENSFWRTLTQNDIQIKPQELKTYKEGEASGILWGGNLATIVSLCGQDFIPNDKFIFFTEDLNEPVYKIDKYFHQLLNIPEFRNNIQALVLGDFLDVDNQEWLEELFEEIGEELQIPTFGGFPISHSSTKATIPYGGYGTLKNGIITVTY